MQVQGKRTLVAILRQRKSGYTKYTTISSRNIVKLLNALFAETSPILCMCGSPGRWYEMYNVGSTTSKQPLLPHTPQQLGLLNHLHNTLPCYYYYMNSKLAAAAAVFMMINTQLMTNQITKQFLRVGKCISYISTLRAGRF